MVQQWTTTVGGTKVGREAYGTTVDYYCRWHQSGPGGLRYNSGRPTVGGTKVGREACDTTVDYLL